MENNIYCATENGQFYYNKDDYTINRLNKINGLSDVGISCLAYDKENKIVIIAYNNTNIDLIKNESFINITDIKLKDIFGEKKIPSYQKTSPYRVQLNQSSNRPRLNL